MVEPLDAALPVQGEELRVEAQVVDVDLLALDVELDLEPAPETTPSEAAQAESIASTPIIVPEQISGGTTRKVIRKKKDEE